MTFVFENLVNICLFLKIDTQFLYLIISKFYFLLMYIRCPHIKRQVACEKEVSLLNLSFPLQLLLVSYPPEVGYVLANVI